MSPASRLLAFSYHCVSLIAAQRLTELITNYDLNTIQCATLQSCDQDERCEKVCFWEYPGDTYVGCKVACVKSPDRIEENGLSLQRVPINDVALPVSPSSNTIQHSPAHELDSRPFQDGPSNPTQQQQNGNSIPRQSSNRAPQSQLTLTRLLGTTTRAPLLTNASSNVSPITTPDLGHCPPPPVCSLFCGIAQDENGCQTCVCIEPTHPGECQGDRDCRHDQICEANKCVEVTPTDVVGTSTFVSIEGARPLIRTDCVTDDQCAIGFVCCSKEFCDRTGQCANTKICLLHC